jgi:hypothetical protein
MPNLQLGAFTNSSDADIPVRAFGTYTDLLLLVKGEQFVESKEKPEHYVLLWGLCLEWYFSVRGCTIFWFL